MVKDAVAGSLVTFDSIDSVGASPVIVRLANDGAAECVTFAVGD
jgi:hypothetical protein